MDWPGSLHAARAETDSRTACAGVGAGCARRTCSSTARAWQTLAQATALPDGLTRIRLAFEKGRHRGFGRRRRPPGRDADFKARLRLAAGAGGALRISVEDIRVQGAPPLALSAIGAAVLDRVRADAHAGRQDRSEDALELDVLRPALDELLVAEGWRLPDSAHASPQLGGGVGARAGAVVGRGQRRTPRRSRRAMERTSQGYEPPVAALRRSVDEAPPGPERALVAQKLARRLRARERRGRRGRRPAGLHRERGARAAGRDGLAAARRAVRAARRSRTPRRGP